MIAEYENSMFSYFRKMFPQIKEASYSANMEIFNAISSVKKYPALYFYREEQNWVLPKRLSVRDEDKRSDFFQTDQKYIARLNLEKQSEVIEAAGVLRLYWANNPYLNVTTNDGLKVRVGLRLLYIKIIEERNNVNEKGGLRSVELCWVSQLFYNSVESITLVTGYSLVVNVKNNNENLVVYESN